ncbi:MAG: methyltransferase domain-containing protein [Chloroflexi bacterium]|nr:methyltransferase domain-containing protein [Chloroflexota bacterium]
MPDLMSALLFERDGRALVAHRRLERAPFAGQWALPMTAVRDDEAAEDAVRRCAREQFGLTPAGEQFADTVYLEDPDDHRRYVANIFRAPLDGAPLRFNAAGDHDDARWLAAGDLDDVPMPPPMRTSLAKLLTEPPDATATDWAKVYEDQAAPLAEAAVVQALAPPDNRAGWDTIAKAYQEQVYGDRFPGRFMWSWSTSEDQVQLLGDVRGKRVLVLGCGGGQDVVVLARMGALAVGIDQSQEQIAYAKQFAAKHGEPNASFAAGTVEDLSRFDDASFDLAVSAHMLNYVERIESTLRETHRVLRPGGALAISVRHPADAMLSDAAPYCVAHAYWDAQQDWDWDLGAGAIARFRQWMWPVSRWFEMLTDAGFALERMLEPREVAPDDTHGHAGRQALVPYTLYLKARKR